MIVTCVSAVVLCRRAQLRHGALCTWPADATVAPMDSPRCVLCAVCCVLCAVCCVWQDPVARRKMWEIIRCITPNRTSLLTTHMLEEVCPGVMLA